MNLITYNVVSSTEAGEYIRAQEGHVNAHCDSMITISLCYGKQTMVSEDRGNQNSATADGVAGAVYDNVEQPKHLFCLRVYDLGPRDSDQDWHSPLLTIATLRCMKNMRIRSQQAEQRRRETWAHKNQVYVRNDARFRAESRDIALDL